ncbi:Adenylyltransferase and sulfurtransferase MOCS3 [Camellia lanceoleosa]|uniref:Adenylyltransferase and sulfurtransferase MOCS3 n=1 Tax=Camellia lanceoleosa TaxID=1840588 RepID=A0ACC0HCF3_9ERIC|nr:Adenylyltransferase and sulfurtransferase MOCS3 [Camellia lanceoleosa]
MKLPDGIHFWMQDSFGGNSKTKIIANDSPSIEDASGNVTALQRQIQQLQPLVSGGAVGLEGQLTVYNYDGGPCYRCLFPTPPSATTCQRCSDSGVLGVVPGIIGCLQALEAIKIASAIGEPLSGRMLLLDALSARIRIVCF